MNENHSLNGLNQTTIEHWALSILYCRLVAVTKCKRQLNTFEMLPLNVEMLRIVALHRTKIIQQNMIKGNIHIRMGFIKKILSP